MSAIRSDICARLERIAAGDTYVESGPTRSKPTDADRAAPDDDGGEETDGGDDGREAARAWLESADQKQIDELDDEIRRSVGEDEWSTYQVEDDDPEWMHDIAESTIEAWRLEQISLSDRV